MAPVAFADAAFTDATGDVGKTKVVPFSFTVS